MKKITIVRIIFLALMLMVFIHILVADNRNNLLAILPGIPLGLFIVHEAVLRPRMKRSKKDSSNTQ